jgi:hypothetical protein
MANGPTYPVECADLDAPDLPTLPTTTAEAFAKAVSEAQQRGTKVVAAVGRILPHSRKRVGR